MGLRRWLKRRLGGAEETTGTPEMPRRFEEALASAVAEYDGDHAEAIRLGPDLYRALSNLMEDGRVHDEARGRVCRAIAYFIMPYDVLPEELYGPEGYLDDVYYCLWTVDRLAGELPEHVLEEAWEGEGSLLEVTAEFLPGLRDALDAEEREKILRYVGLRKELEGGS